MNRQLIKEVQATNKYMGNISTFVVVKGTKNSRFKFKKFYKP